MFLFVGIKEHFMILWGGADLAALTVKPTRQPTIRCHFDTIQNVLSGHRFPCPGVLH